MIAVLFTAVGVGGFVVGIVSATRSIPPFEYRNDGPQAEATVQLSAGTRYAAWELEGSTDSCSFDQGITTHGTKTSFTVTRDGRDWQRVTDFSVATDGAYQISCGPPFAIGEAPELGQLAGGLTGGILALTALPCLGVTIGGIIALVTGLRRSSHKRRLLGGA
ncbi:hypothetical protein GCM10020369_62440 [Cryptosporangium minutisporangium]|uniref:Uncharacterized protein n=1 Tax=Cryptosporangium minutisporangium TaxID=113569 RepID=A0ABP6T814_9ACTN